MKDKYDSTTLTIPIKFLLRMKIPNIKDKVNKQIFKVVCKVKYCLKGQYH